MKMRKLILFSILLFTVAFLGSEYAAAQGTCKAPAGASISPEGVFLVDGKPFHGIGMNYFGVFNRRLANPKDDFYREGFKMLAEHKVPFVRFMAGGFWPVEYKLYQKDKEAYFRLMDDVVKAAEENHVGLVASLFWFHATIPDFVGEHIDQWGNPESKTHAFMRQYIQEVVSRYKDSPAIWGWEFANEPNLLGDLPNSADQRPFVRPDLGTPRSRNKHDELTQKMLLTADMEFAKAVSAIDPRHLIVTGNSIPRPCAYHNSFYNSWDLDTRNQFAEMLLRDNPDPMNGISVHLYWDVEDTYFADKKVNLSGLTREMMRIAAAVRKPLFIGEVGVSGEVGREKERESTIKLIKAIEENNVQLSAMWDFDNGGGDARWNITPTNERGYILDLVAEANTRMQARSKADPCPAMAGK